MAIYLIEGPPGNGKSAYGARAIARALAKRRPVVTNIEPRSDFADFVASKTAGVSRSKRRRRAGEIARSMHYSPDPDDLFRVRLRGRGEGRGLAVLDEAASWLNARSWSDANRGDSNDWFRKHRHRGFDVLLLVQDKDMLDKQVRSLPEVVVEMRNARKFRRAGIPIIPFHFFIAVHYWHAGGGPMTRVVLRKEAFRLGWWKDLYDTHAEGETVIGDDGDDLLWLPHPQPTRCRSCGEWFPVLTGRETCPGCAASTTPARELDRDDPANPVQVPQLHVVPSDPPGRVESRNGNGTAVTVPLLAPNDLHSSVAERAPS